VSDERHLRGYTLSLVDVPARPPPTLAWAAVNYHYGALGRGGGVALAPRVTVLVPTGHARDGLGSAGTGCR
jgi:hypothetical protein